MGSNSYLLIIFGALKRILQDAILESFSASIPNLDDGFVMAFSSSDISLDVLPLERESLDMCWFISCLVSATASFDIALLFLDTFGWHEKTLMDEMDGFGLKFSLMLFSKSFNSYLESGKSSIPNF